MLSFLQENAVMKLTSRNYVDVSVIMDIIERHF